MKYFIVSDIHGFYDELKKSLSEAGFNKKNKNHTLIVLGDVFDRGPHAISIYKFLKSIPSNRRILIKGNHESLYLELLDKNYPETHDFSNCTVDTFCQIAKVAKFDGIKTSTLLKSSYYYINGTYYDNIHVGKIAQDVWNKIKKKVSRNRITKWIRSTQWRDYFELDKFIFVHSFIPLLEEFDPLSCCMNKEKYSYLPHWRDLCSELWEDARWGCPYLLFKKGYFDEEIKKGKVLVCGHWHTSAFFDNLKPFLPKKEENHGIYFSENLIGIDGGVFYDWKTNHYSHPQNVLVIDDNLICYNTNGDRLIEPQQPVKTKTKKCTGNTNN